VLVDEGKRCPPGLSVPWLPTRLFLSVVHLVSSPTISTCAPGVVRHPITAALLAHCLVEFYLTVLGHCLYRQAPTATSGEKHSPNHLHTDQSWYLTLQTPLKERFVACRAAARLNPCIYDQRVQPGPPRTKFYPIGLG
jgi:hypothetical protein